MGRRMVASERSCKVLNGIYAVYPENSIYVP